MGSTFVEDLEEVVEEVSSWAVDIVTTVTDLLASDGRPFGQENLTDEEQLTEYNKLVGNSEAWESWILEKTILLAEGLLSKGINPEAIAAIKPTEIITAYAIEYSSSMEDKLKGDL